ncbi:MAG: hypothetical protein R3F53_26285 [Gammaproteobacteria bacterium]
MSIAALLVSACAGDKMMQDEMMPFGGPDSVAYAGDLWQALQSARLVGPGAIETKAYPGQHPHGAVLQNVDGMLTVNGVTSPVIVKNNYGGEGVSVENVTRNPSQYLAAVTVMYKRPGYDPDNNDGSGPNIYRMARWIKIPRAWRWPGEWLKLIHRAALPAIVQRRVAIWCLPTIASSKRPDILYRPGQRV